MKNAKTFIKRALRRLWQPVRRVPEKSLPDWKTLLDTNRPLWNDARTKAASGPRVLIATNVGGVSPCTVVESVLAVALTLRGARVDTLLCDAALPACLRAEIQDIPDPGVFERNELSKIACDACQKTGRLVFDPIGLDGHHLSGPDVNEARDLAARVPLAAVRDFKLDGRALGEHAYAGALRYFASGDIAAEPHGEIVARRYLEAAVLTARALDRLLDRRRFDAACFHHGLYVPQGIVGEVCRARGLRVTNWNVAYRKSCFIFSHGDTYHHTLLDEPADAWESMAWSSAHAGAIADYLDSRRGGSRDWIWFHNRPDENVVAFAAQTGLDLKKPVIGLLTNVMWDAQLHYRANAFPSMLDWAVGTIRWFEKRPDLQLLIRVHPAELRGTLPSRQPILAEIAKAVPNLPRNVFVIPPESELSTYAAAAACDSVIIYGTKTGVELTSVGIPVIVAGEAWIRNKGLTLDASTQDEYYRLLDRLPLRRRGTDAEIERAQKYAYHFFFRRMIPFPFMTPAKGWPPFRVGIAKLDDLLPGVHPGLDVVCDGILKGSPYVYPAERLGVHDA